ncbi:hypothetical protein [Arthrobacter sulfonylureivorans]|uniref:Integral membrane protein n=1 Tax=Arthrobacter sulfonylureivorans TaxID=2486855 RepID=A0ABY3WBR2_9MICC|nr:hypothetical protein [Arthrobacter sulfonylureivorans]UNK47815.1 hypothetical protein MNQ99_18235 [Arthrobacter sulfonylureivorans]
MNEGSTDGAAGRRGARIAAGVAAVGLFVWATLTSLAGIFALAPEPGDPLTLVLSALLTAGLLALPAGIIVFAAARWRPGLTMLVTHGVFTLAVTAVFYVMVAPGLWGAVGMALSAAVLALGLAARGPARTALAAD